MRRRNRVREKTPAQHDRKLVQDLETTARFVFGYFNDNLLEHLDDPRSKQGRGWKSAIPILKAVCLGLASACKGLKAVERLTDSMFSSVRKSLGILRRVPDTTARGLLVRLDPLQLSKLIYIVGYDAWRRGAFQRIAGFPFHVISDDGKYPTVTDVGQSKTKGYKKSPYLQVHHDKEGNPQHGEIRTINSCLITAKGQPIVGSVPVPGNTNEQVTFRQAFGELVQYYGRLFKLVMYDAGAACAENAWIVRQAGKHYLFQIANENWVMYKTMALLLKGRKPQATHTHTISVNERVDAELTLASVVKTKKSLTMWPSVRTIFRVVNRHFKDGALVSTKVRYLATSMDSSELAADKWLELLIRRWGVEILHMVLDVSFEEDDHPWIPADARGALAVGLLRRVVMLLMTLHKFITLQDESKQHMPWKELMALIKRTLEWPGGQGVIDLFDGLRTHQYQVPPALA